MAHAPPNVSDRLAQASQALETPDLASYKDAVGQLEDNLFINQALPGLIPHEPTALLLDINNLYRRSRSNDFRIDYVKLRRVFSDRCDLRLAAAFSAVDSTDKKARDWVNLMRDNGYRTWLRDLKRYTNVHGKVITKGNMDIDLTLTAINLSQGFSHVIIGTCDGDFVPLVDELRKGFLRKVSVLGVRNADWTGMSNNLVDAADNFYDMSMLLPHIAMSENHGERFEQ